MRLSHLVMASAAFAAWPGPPVDEAGRRDPTAPTRPASSAANCADAHQGRNVIERFSALAKQWRGIATRFDKLAITCRGGAPLSAILAWCASCGTQP